VAFGRVGTLSLPTSLRCVVHYGGADHVAGANDEIVVMAMIETQDVTCLLSAALDAPPPLSIMELQRLGKASGRAWTPRQMSRPNERHGTDRSRP
jgi:hypothetical protein